MTHDNDYEANALAALQRAVAKALDRKRRLGQYAVMWRDGQVVCVIPDAPPGTASDSTPNRLGFLKGQLQVPEDFNTMGQAEIAKLFGTDK